MLQIYKELYIVKHNLKLKSFFIHYVWNKISNTRAKNWNIKKKSYSFIFLD